MLKEIAERVGCHECLYNKYQSTLKQNMFLKNQPF